MDTTELKRLAANTPVHDARRYALRRAAHEIERLEAELAAALAKRTRPPKFAASTPYEIPNSTAGLGGLDGRGANVRNYCLICRREIASECRQVCTDCMNKTERCYPEHVPSYSVIHNGASHE